MDLKISDLPPQFENIANRLGIEKAKWLFEEFGGTSVYFPTEKMIYKEARDREIVSEYNGFNHRELAAKYNMSESYIRAIINRQKKVLKKEELHT
ncbi:MAG: Mor transcription activator family protein [Paraclostridium sp.]